MSSKTLNHDSLLRKRALNIWFEHFKKKWIVYILGIASIALACSMQVMSTRILGWTLDFFEQQTLPAFMQSWSSDRNTTFKILFFMLAASRTLLFLARIGWRLALTRQTHWASSKLKSDIWKHVRFFTRRNLARKYNRGVLMNITTSDINSARFTFGFTLVALFDVIFLGTIAVATMFSIHPPLALWATGVVVFLPYFIKKVSDKETRLYRLSQEYLGVFNELCAQIVSTIRLQRFTHTSAAWKKRFLFAAEEYRRQRLKTIQTALFYIPVMGLSSVIGYLVLFSVGVHFIFEGSLSLGNFVTMQGLIFLIQDPLAQFGFTISELKRGLVSLERIAEIHTCEKDPDLTRRGERVETLADTPVLQVKNLNFQYPSGQVPILQNINLSARTGERIGFFGPIGSGKSTLLRILSGIERRVEGEVKLCGKDFGVYQHHQLRQYIGLVEQESFLFASSIRQNVCLDRQLCDDEIWHYLKLAEFAGHVMRLPYQLETPLGEAGVNLSGGQKQRLALARTLARRPRLLLLDDCLSAVDNITEEKILTSLDEEFKDITVVWVAHRKSTLKYCHRVMEMA